MEVFGVIYLITNLLNGMKYVGQTIQPLKARIAQHKRGDLYIDKAIQMYGLENFTVEVLEECATREQLSEREIFWIAALNSKKPNGYNCTDGGEGTFGLSSEESFTLSVLQRKATPYVNLRQEMDARHMTGTALARFLKLSPKSFSAKMRGEQKFTVSQAAKLERIFGLPIELLLARDDGLPTSLSSHYKSYYKTPYGNLLNLILEQKFTYTSLAKTMGLSQSSFASKMRGEINFSPNEVAKLEEILGLPREILLARDDGLPTTLSRYRKTPFRNLVAEMKSLHFSQAVLAQLMGIHPIAFSLKMSGKRKFTAKDKAKLEEILQKPAEFLLKRFDS